MRHVDARVDHRVEHAVHRRVERDRQTERDDGDDAESAMARERADGDAEVGTGEAHGWGSDRVEKPAGLPQGRRADGPHDTSRRFGEVCVTFLGGESQERTTPRG